MVLAFLALRVHGSLLQEARSLGFPAFAHVAHSYVGPTRWTDALQLAWCCSRTRAKERKLWTLTLLLAVLNSQLHFSQDQIKGNGNLETQRWKVNNHSPSYGILSKFIFLRYGKGSTTSTGWGKGHPTSTNNRTLHGLPVDNQNHP